MPRKPKEIIELEKLRNEFTLTPAEQETNINFDRASPNVTIYTTDQTVMNKLDSLGYELIRTDTVNKNIMSKTYKCEKRCISFRSKEKQTRRRKKQ